MEDNFSHFYTHIQKKHFVDRRAVKASHILISFVTNLCRRVLCAVKKWEMDSRHEYMPLIYQPPLPLSIYSSEILLLSPPPSCRNTMLAPHKQLYQNIGPFQRQERNATDKDYLIKWVYVLCIDYRPCNW